MSMNYFFVAFDQKTIESMTNDHSLIDEYVLENRSGILSTDIENAWDVLANILDGQGFYGGEFIDDVLLNGGFLVSAKEVKIQAALLARWTPEAVLERLREIDDGAELYRLDLYKGNEEMLLREFDILVNFYKESAEKGLGVVNYPA